MTTREKKAEKRYKEEQARRQSETKIWDRQSLFTLLATVLFVGFFVFLTKSDYNNFFIRDNNDWDIAIGKIDSIDELTGINQSRAGNRIMTTGYKIKYTYLIGKDEYSSESTLAPTKNQFVYYAREVIGEWKIGVYYEKKNKSNSRINIDLKSDFYKKLKESGEK